MRVSVISPVLNEVAFIGYSIMSCLDNVHEFVYALDDKSDDGTRDLLHHIKDKYAHEKLVILDHSTFHPLDMKPYNAAFNRCIAESTGECVWFYHPDMIVTKWIDFIPGPMAWWTNITSVAGDFDTVITKGRCDKWKNIHAKKFGLTYWGGYGSQNEDFYHSDITGNSHKHFGTEFSKYPFQVANSGIEVLHCCEMKDYRRRLEKMKLCLKTLIPSASDEAIEESAVQHPRVSLDGNMSRFGEFEFTKMNSMPEVVIKYRDEFMSFKKELVHHG